MSNWDLKIWSLQRTEGKNSKHSPVAMRYILSNSHTIEVWCLNRPELANPWRFAIFDEAHPLEVMANGHGPTFTSVAGQAEALMKRKKI